MIVVIAQKEELKLVEELGYDNYPVFITGVGKCNKRIERNPIKICFQNYLWIKVMERVFKKHSFFYLTQKYNNVKISIVKVKES